MDSLGAARRWLATPRESMAGMAGENPEDPAPTKKMSRGEAARELTGRRQSRVNGATRIQMTGRPGYAVQCLTFGKRVHLECRD